MTDAEVVPELYPNVVDKENPFVTAFSSYTDTPTVITSDRVRVLARLATLDH